MTSVLLIPLLGAAVHVCLGTEVMTEPDQNHAIKSCVGLTVATPVQPMPIGLPGGSRNWTHSTQRGEGSLGVDALGVTASRDKQSCCRVGSYSEDADEGRAAVRVSRSIWARRSRTSLSSWM